MNTCTHRVFVCEHMCRLNMVHIHMHVGLYVQCDGCVSMLR